MIGPIPGVDIKYIDDIEAREDGGTPAFLQTIKAAMCITLKDEMGISKIQEREHHLLDLLWDILPRSQSAYPCSPA